MKAMLVDEKQMLVWSDVADPICNDDTIIIDVEAAALNRADLLQRVGKYPSPKGWPEWMGLEVAGKVAKMGSLAAEKSQFKVGDHGVARTRLALIGEALINGQIVEVKSEGGFINENEEIEIIRVSGNSLFVAKVKSNDKK